LVHLVRDAQGERPGALDALLATLRPSFVLFFAPNVGPDAAEDLAQTALLRIARALRAIDPQHIRAFLVTMVWNILRSERRREARHAHLCAAFAETLEEAADPDPEVEACDLVDAFRRTSLTMLSPKLRDTMLGTLAGLTPSTRRATASRRPWSATGSSARAPASGLPSGSTPRPEARARRMRTSALRATFR